MNYYFIKFTFIALFHHFTKKKKKRDVELRQAEKMENKIEEKLKSDLKDI